MISSFRSPLLVAALIALAGCGIFKGGTKKTPTVGNRTAILVAENAIEADRTIADVPVLLPAATANDSWSQPGGNAAKSLGQLALADAPVRAWTASINGGSDRQRLAAPPVVADGKLFVTDVDARVHAITAATGARLWSASVSKGDDNRDARFGGGVSYDNGQVFATNGLGDVVALQAADGAEVWRAKPGGPLRGSPTIANGVVYVLTQDDQMFALNQQTGAVNWAAQGTAETQGVFGVAAPAAAAGSVVAGFSSGELNAYRYENGRQLWQDALSRTSITTSVSSIADIDAAPVIDNGRVYAVGQGGRMVALELATGRRLWEQNLAGISTPWLAGEWLFVVTDDARLICLATASGKARWIAQLPRFRNAKGRKGLITWFGPVLAGNRLVMTNSRGEVVFANATDGTIARTVESGEAFTLPPVVANSTLYTLDQKGRVTAWR
ncbi:MAG: pyrrolo-quinoline quinone [Sphingomonas bacterium]|uniref:outer membrane protein assembly factor BamB family protein n=1 Tax=Sphingomonas bacterium TaxID=1895847 RepID=UPI00260A85B7|nr:PQQ-binding-like beta-propeller repeat protein [Sphingomonas bacterium]MDB5696025.1 pyrrolo-quinoline quinone [Sphingomonas bacterium]